ncbi:sigma factor-like helix-turn-helix DNA-binding protein [Mycetocola sp. 2940]|uniref:sigma factor-like helix-turn-helix DNA-binding protein n=1 Tax=Mycetocola sp. 2940 TaxID=3156452 RepID=UPI003394EA05
MTEVTDRTTGPESEGSPRNDLIVKRFVEELLTLEQIADEFGVSRARIGQILKEANVDARAVQRQRTLGRADVRAGEVRSFADEISDAAVRLAALGLARADIEANLAAFRPDTDPGIISASIDYLRDAGRLVIDRSGGEQKVPDSVLRSSLLYAVGRRYELVAPQTSAELSMDPEMVADTNRVLASAGVPPEEILQVLNVIQAASERIAADESVTLSGTSYDATRAAFLADHPASDRQAVAWPVGSLTVSRRLGGSWNAALSSLGIKTQSAPEGFGAAQYTRSELARTIRDFIASGVGTAYADYEQWVQTEKGSGRVRPSGPSVRYAYGSWNDAVRSGGDAERVDRVTERRLRKPATQSTLDELIEHEEGERERLSDELMRQAESGKLTPELLESIEHQKAVATATLHRYRQEGERWDEQVRRWAKQDTQGDRQFKINLWLAVAIGASAAIAPMVVWWLDRLFPVP